MSHAPSIAMPATARAVKSGFSPWTTVAPAATARDMRPSRELPPVARAAAVAVARAAVEPQLLRLAVERGDLAWEAGVRETFRTLDRTPVHDGDGPQVSEAWSVAHHRFHRALLEGCGNPVLLDRSVWADVAASAHGDQGARNWLRAHADLVRAVPCDDTGSPDDIDTPDDLRRVQSA